MKRLLTLEVHRYLTSNKLIFALICILTATLLTDTLIVTIYYFTINQLPVTSREGLFFVIYLIFLVSLYLLYIYVKHRTRNIKSSKLMHLDRLTKLTLTTQYIIGVILLFLIIQISFKTSYSVILLAFATSISYSVAVVTMITLAKSFMAWFASKKSLVVLLYGSACVMFATNLVFTIVLVNAVLANVPSVVVPHVGTGYPFFSFGSFTDLINYGITLSSVLSFVLWWFATVVILQHHSKTSKKIWIAFGVPLIYFLLQFQPLFVGLFSQLFVSNPVLYSSIYIILFTLSEPIGGILFSITFWIIARKFDSNSNLRNYMILSAYGVLLIFVCNQAGVLVNVAYPPFGIVTASLMSFSSYLVLVGIYSAAISVAQDSGLRKSIRDLAVEEIKFLHNIGTAQMEKALLTKVLSVTKKNKESLTNETGVDSSMTEENMKEYLDQVLREIKSSKSK